jgi:deoxyribodipyrimidine photolyase-related protein
MVTRLILVLGDQLDTQIAALRQADKSQDIIVMAEVMAEATYTPHHVKKIAFIFAAMRKFAAHLRDAGWSVAYTRLDDAGNTGTILGELSRLRTHHHADGILATEPGEWRLLQDFQTTALPITVLPDDRFLCTRDEFSQWAKGRKHLRMEYFYRDMRRKTGVLMDGDAPIGGKWNYDSENRKPAPKAMDDIGPMRFDPDPIVAEVLDLVETRFSSHFGTLRPFWFATDRAQALAALDHFIQTALPQFGDYQDAMMRGEKFMYHSVISHYLNAGLLRRHEICAAVERAYHRGHAPLNAVEGYIRQIIGWREFIRGIYWHEGPDYTARNELGHTRALPEFYWSGDTDMQCMAQTITQTRNEAYAHHIQRLMITGNFALLAGIDPAQVHQWYLAVYADAYEWVEAPNTIGMSQFADGGIVASKPYVSGGNYIHKMSNYCASCRYRVTQKTGPDACPFGYLYWAFLHRHRDRFAANPRMAQMYRVWARMDDAKQRDLLDSADQFLARLAAADRV